MPTAIRQGSIHTSLLALYENFRAPSYHNIQLGVVYHRQLRMLGIIESCTISFFAGPLDFHSDQLYSCR